MKPHLAASRVIALCCGLITAGYAEAETIVDFRSTSNGIDSSSSGQVVADDVVLSVAAQPTSAGAMFREFNAGLGIQSRGADDQRDGELDKFDLVRDLNSGNTITGEAMVFSFDKPGVLVEFDFDGVKDEAYEYFMLQTSTSADLYFFDSFQNTMGGDPGLIDVPGQVVFLQEGNSLIDDRSPRMSIPFAADQQFMLTYGQLDGIQTGQLEGNGARLQGITVVTVPEPSGGLLVLCLATAAACWKSIRRI